MVRVTTEKVVRGTVEKKVSGEGDDGEGKW